MLSQANKINEYLLTTLRTSWGCDMDYLKTELNHDLTEESGDTLHTLAAHGLLEKRDHFLVLTHQGKLVADKIAADLFVNE